MSAGIRIAARPNADEHRDEDHDDSVPPANPDAFNVAPGQDLHVPVYALAVPEGYRGSLAAAVDHGPGLQALAYTVATQQYTHHPHNGTNGSADDDDDGGSDSDGSLESLASEDFPTYFEEHRGRLFHSHGNLNNAGLDPGYILPVDGPELQRYNATHTLLRRVLGSNFFAPLAQSLVDGATVLDLCTGTGLWTMEMARAYPQVEFHGLDMVPITSRYPENNVTFELTDVRLRLRFGHASIDIVHARNTNMSVQGYARMLAEAARVLRPGGIFVAGEWVTYAPTDTQPHLAQFWQEANEAINGQVITPLALAIPHIIDASGAFSPPVSHLFAFPLGELDPNAAHTFGPDVAQALDAVGQTMRLLTVAHIEALHAGVPALAGSAAAAIEEVERAGVGRVAIWHGVWASRI